MGQLEPYVPNATIAFTNLTGLLEKFAVNAEYHFAFGGTSTSAESAACEKRDLFGALRNTT